MKHAQRRNWTPLVVSLAVAALAGCGAMDVKQDAVEKTQIARKGPELPPQRSITNFSVALRCMDGMLIDHGVRDVTILVEDIVDQTKKVNAGTKDMLISAVSDMTKRSRAVRLVAFGPDANNLIAFMQQAEQRGAYAVMPQYDIKGSITQLDEKLISKQADAGLGFNPYFNIGVAKDAASSILGLDLTILRTEDMSVVSGATSRNSVVIFKEGKGVDADASIKKFGINFSMSLSKAEGQSQALRTLVELATIELFGKLTKTPYWACLGVDARDEAVRNEMADWYYVMSAHPGELVAYFQRQMRVRGYYNGPLDGRMNPQLATAVAKYRALLGLSEEPLLDYEFFAAYLAADHAALLAASPPPAPVAALGAASVPATQAASAPKPSKAPPAAPAQETLKLEMVSANGANKFKPGEVINLVIKPSRDAHVYCFLRDENQKIQRFHPNRFARDSLVRAGTPLQVPGSMRFQIVANDKGRTETVACYATDRDVMKDLPAAVTGTDFENLSVASLDQVKSAFAAASSTGVGQAYLNIEVR
jgi:hypothetical protein